ncbi:MAG TPA: biotin/lipoyl-binding protein, partial [Gemmatimonadales bacterium]|nr:biotin/lipoyl-binding protein [Gemmatimonadales bacterium]
MTEPAYDLSKLRIDRDTPAPARRAFGRRLAVAALALAGTGAGAYLVLRDRAVEVETVVATPLTQPSGGADGAVGSVAVTANGYVVARTRASVSAKIPGRLASLAVDEGSRVRAGQVIARLENADYRAAVAEARANLASARAQLVEAEAERDQARREATRVQQIRAERPELVSAQEVEAAVSRAAQAG